MASNQEREELKIDIRSLTEKLLKLDYLSLLLIDNSVKVLAARNALAQPPEPKKTA